jgi:hypothetical protein
MMEHIGVLLVHGIGEQGAYQHLENEVRSFADALRSKHGKDSVTMRVRTTRDASPGAVRETWAGEDNAPVEIDVRRADGDVRIHFHEVWWADIGERTGIASNLRFWRWGLARWFARRPRPEELQVEDGKLLPSFDLGSWSDGERLWWRVINRIWLLLASWFFLMLLFTWTLLKQFARPFMQHAPSPSILVSYLGDVKLYQDSEPLARGPIQDHGRTPRQAILRRMTNAMVDMALGWYEAPKDNTSQGTYHPYDRWYILAHSLGSVVAWDGINQTGQSLAGCLANERRRDAYRAARKRQPGAAVTEIDRGWLFERLHGLCTYGSPLDKFAYLWPQLVARHRDVAAFPSGFRWINVYDPTDPVGARLDAYDYAAPAPNAGDERMRPWNWAYKASPWLLLSHLRYLTPAPGQADRLVDHLAGWLLDDRFDARTGGAWHEAQPDGGRPFRSRYLKTASQWVAAGALLAALFSFVVRPAVKLVGTFLSWIVTEIPGADRLEGLLTQVGAAWTSFAQTYFSGAIGIYVHVPLAFAAFTLAIVVIFGVVARLCEACRRLQPGLPQAPHHNDRGPGLAAPSEA